MTSRPDEINGGDRFAVQFWRRLTPGSVFLPGRGGPGWTLAENSSSIATFPPDGQIVSQKILFKAFREKPESRVFVKRAQHIRLCAYRLCLMSQVKGETLQRRECPQATRACMNMNDHQINFLGWVLFLVSAVGFCIASIGHFWAMFGSTFFLIACLVFMVPFFRNPRE